MDEELDHFKREVNLTELAASLGYRSDRAIHPSVRTSVAMRHPDTNDKIIVRRDRDGHWTYFSVRNDRDNGSVIDFLQKRHRLDLGAVCDELRAWLRIDRLPISPVLYCQYVDRQTYDRSSVETCYARALAVSTSSYLVSRGLLAATLRDRRFRGTFRVDVRGNVLFPHVTGDNRQVVGYEVKNRGFTGFSAGGRKTFWLSATRLDDVRLVIVEATIDALSYHQLRRDAQTTYLSTGGTVGTRQLELIRGFIGELPNRAEVVAATDNDAAGDKLAHQIAGVSGAIPVRRHAPPFGKDWNDYLQILHPPLSRRTGHRLER